MPRTGSARFAPDFESNRLIGTAIGMLMATHRLTASQGFAVLVRASQDSNSKLRDLAAVVVETGRLPFRPTKNDDVIIRATNPRV